MKSVIIIRNYEENIYITLGKALEALKKAGKDLQIESIIRRYPKCSSFGECMDLISQYVTIIVEEEQ